MEKILTVNDVAEILQVKAITVREMFREKRLRGFKVGKAWRTTEVMLEEDIAALARGESPALLPSPSESSAPQPTAPPSEETAPAPKPPVEPKSEKKPRKPAEPAEQEDDEDTQQLLF